MEKQFNPEPSYRSRSSETHLVHLIREALEPIDSLESPPLASFINRCGESRVVLLGEATHGTEEFYKLRGKITRQLIEEKTFNLVALEADWPDVEQINDYIHGRRDDWNSFHRFPEWMWRNTAFAEFVDDLRNHNLSEACDQPVSIFGLDLYSLSASMKAVLRFLEGRDSESARRARHAHECLHRWHDDPARYGLAVWREQIQSCESEVLQLLHAMHERRVNTIGVSDGELLSALQNARVLRNAEEYYRRMYEGEFDSWNLRDRHMFETLSLLLDHFGAGSKVVVWEHNSHVGDARATEMGKAGELTLGQLCRSKFADGAYLTGLMTDHGSVAAASAWNGPMFTKTLNPVQDDSYEALMHSTGVPAFFLPLRSTNAELREALCRPRIERAIGVLYLPESERRSHYLQATLPEQFDEIIWIDETEAVIPLIHVPETEETDTYPYGI